MAPKSFTVGKMRFEKVSYFRYHVRAMIFNHNRMNREINKRVTDRVYCANKLLLGTAG